MSGFFVSENQNAFIKTNQPNQPFMKTNAVTFILLLMLSLTAIAQEKDYAFKVLVNKGKNEVKTGDTWAPIKTGSMLKATDEVKLVANSYLGLIHANGKPLELKEPRNYKVSELSAKVGAGSSVLNKYTDFILSSNTEKKNKLSATGAVHRGGNSTKVYLPKSEFAVLYGDTVILDWEKVESATPVTYIVILKSMFGDDLYRVETSEQTVALNLADPKFLNEDNIIIEIYPKGQEDKKPDPPYMLKRMSSADKERMKNLVDEISGQAYQASALNKLIMAGFFEQNKLLIDAGTAYLEAIKLAPEVEQYKEDYNSFLVRNGIKEEKKDK
jgi:hypothetical protein